MTIDAMHSRQVDRGCDLGLGAASVAVAFVASGLLHLVRPQAFDPLVPEWLPRRREVVLASGAAELACGAGLLTRRRWAPVASAALLLGVWPGNVHYAWRVQRNPDSGTAHRLVAWARLPLQIPMIRWALRPDGGADRMGCSG